MAFALQTSDIKPVPFVPHGNHPGFVLSDKFGGVEKITPGDFFLNPASETVMKELHVQNILKLDSEEDMSRAQQREQNELPVQQSN